MLDTVRNDFKHRPPLRRSCIPLQNYIDLVFVAIARHVSYPNASEAGAPSSPIFTNERSVMSELPASNHTCCFTHLDQRGRSI